MSRFMGIEQNTVMKCPQTVIRAFTSERAAKQWLEEWDSPFAFPGAARNDIPGYQQNWHHRLRTVYRMPAGWRKPSKSQIDRYVQTHFHSSYRRRSEDAVAEAIWREN